MKTIYIVIKHRNTVYLSFKIIAIIQLHEEIHDIPKELGCFDPSERGEAINVHIIPMDIPLSETSPGCISIGMGTVENKIIHIYDVSQERQTIDSQGCFQPVEQNDNVSFYSQDKQIESENKKNRYQGEKARNWDEFENNCHMGQKYGKKFVHTGMRNPKDGSPIRQLIEDIPNTEMFKKGYYFALDKFHEGDHFEVWKNKKWIGVANLDGSKNEKKTNAESNTKKRGLDR